MNGLHTLTYGHAMKNENNQSLPPETDVLIVGYGPVGAALAVSLGRFGIRTLVIDRSKEVWTAPRAIALDNEALRTLQMIGLTDDSFARVAIPYIRMHSPYLGQFGQANTGGSIDCHPKLVTFYQPELENALRKQVERLPSVTACTGFELIDLKQSVNEVTAVVKDEAGIQHEIRALYLVGADGAKSAVRSLIGQDFDGQTYSEDWLIVDAIGRESKAIDHVEFLCDPSRPAPHMPAPGGRERWEFMLQPGEKPDEMERPEKLASLLSRWVDAAELTIERHAVYRFHARVCASFQLGRVFLAGDAAHITPPFVGQGLVAGLRDIANLGWKLAFVVQNRAGEALLASYDEERRPHAHKMIELAKVMGRIVMPRSRPAALAIHGAVRVAGALPFLRRLIEELEIKPRNLFRRGCFVLGKSPVKVVRGGQLSQTLVRHDGSIRLSDDLLGDSLVVIGFGVDPTACLDRKLKKEWEDRGGRFLMIGKRGQAVVDSVPFAEDVTDALSNGIPEGWIVVTRPDRVIMHDGPEQRTTEMIRECLHAISEPETPLRKEYV